MMTTKTASSLPAGEDVLRFLEANPDFLIDHRLAANPGGSHSGRVIALSQAVIRRAQEAIRRSQTAQLNMADITAANQTSQAQVFQVACHLMAAQSSAEILTFINQQMPEILGLHAARLVVTPASPLADHDAALACPEKVLPTLTGGEPVRLGKPHAAQAKALAAILPGGDVSTALARLPDLTDDGSPPMMLALVGPDKDSFSPQDGTALLSFTVTLIAIALIARDSSG